MAVDHKCAAPAAGQQVMAPGVGALTLQERALPFGGFSCSHTGRGWERRVLGVCWA